MAEPLAILLQLHEQSVETERLALVDALDRWDAAVAAATAVRRAISRETHEAERPGGDHLVEAFAAWLARARADLLAAEAQEAAAEAAVVRQRASLAAARASARAAETVLQRQAAERRSSLARTAQAELDEIGVRGLNGPDSTE